MGSRKKQRFNWVAVSAVAGAGTAVIAALAWLVPPISTDGHTYVSGGFENNLIDRSEVPASVTASPPAATAHKQTQIPAHRQNSSPDSSNIAPTAPPRAERAPDAAQPKVAQVGDRNIHIGSVESHNQSGGLTVGYVENANSGEPQ